MLLSCQTCKKIFELSQFLGFETQLVQDNFSISQAIQMQQPFSAKEVEHIYSGLDKEVANQTKHIFMLRSKPKTQVLATIIKVLQPIQTQAQSMNYFEFKMAQSCKFVLLHLNSCQLCQ